jgi:hypothetical protein
MAHELISTFPSNVPSGYQHLAGAFAGTAESHGLTLVTIDKDLKRKPLGGQTPVQIITSLK